MAPFIVFSLPRSRSTWLAAALSHMGGEPVGHDIGIECATPEEFQASLRRMAGTCETGAAFAWPLIRREMPDARLAVVRRDFHEVAESLAKHGLVDQTDEMRIRALQLDALSDQPGVFTIDYHEMDGSRGVALAQFCVGATRYDAKRWHGYKCVDVQVNIPTVLARLAHNAPRIAALKAEVARRMRDA